MADARQRESWSHTSAVLALVANVNRDAKKTRAFRPSDFNPLAAASKGKCELRTKDLSILKRVFVERGKA